MNKKYTKDDYFTAASANDLWSSAFLTTERCVQLTKAPKELVNILFDEAFCLLPNQEWERLDTGYLAVQIGCEKAKLT